MRFFRAPEAVYEQARATLDAAWGHPSADGKTITCIEPAATAPRDANGLIVLAVHDAFTAYSVASTMLPQLLASGQVEEITAAEYMAALPTPIPEGDTFPVSPSNPRFRR
jgi:hypothetical protein